MTGPRRSYGIHTERWGIQPTAWIQGGLPTWAWRCAPEGLVTRRQMRERGLSPGKAEVIAQVICRGGRRVAYLYDPAECRPKRAASPAQLETVFGKALRARQWCPACQRHVGYCIRRSLGRCEDCHERRDQAPAVVEQPAPVVLVEPVEMGEAA